jgi:histone deacetylase complex regulatory component SIN3
MFKNELYGPESKIDPDNFIEKVKSALSDKPEMLEEFKRFIPKQEPEERVKVLNKM